MPPQLAKKQISQTSQQSFWTASFVLLSSFIAYGYSYAQSNIFNQVPVIAALMNSSLYSRDFYIQEMTGFTPRFYYYRLVIFLHQLGISLPLAKFGLFLLAFGSMILGLWRIGAYLGRSPFAGMSLAFLGLSVLDGTLGVTDIFRPEPISAIYAMGITIWGIYFCCRKRWILAYALFGSAALLQFLIGFLPACLWGLGLLIETISRRRPAQFVGAFLIFSLLVALVYVPMVATGNTSSEALTDKTLVHLYGYIRHPHHIIESSFPAKEWRDFGVLIASGLLALKLSDKLSFSLKRNLALTLVVACGLLLAGYVFVEQIPIALAAKLQFARVTPFAMITVWAAVSVVASDYHQRKNYPVSLLLLAMPLVDNVGSIMLLAFILLLLFAKSASPKQAYLQPLVKLHNLTLNRQKHINITYALFLIVLLACWSYLPIFFASLAYPLLQQPFPKFFHRTSPYFKAATAGLAFYLCLHLFGIIGSIALTPLHRKIRVYAPPADALSQVAAEFQQVSPVDALVLVPPSDEVFRFYSKRSVVATFKSFPFTDRGILEWQARLKDILGPLESQMMLADYTHELYRERSSEALVELARSHQANYILTQLGWHPNLPGKVVAREGDWAVWQLP